MPIHVSRSHLAGLREPSGRAVSAIRSRPQLFRATVALHNALVTVAALVVALARVDDLACITEVGVDAAQHTSILRSHAFDDDVTGTAVGTAVTATADDLAVVLGVEVLDADCAAAIELEDLV